jgi:hypothetical protein
MRLGARVVRATGATKHYQGLPPELTPGRDTRIQLPTADMVILVFEDETPGDCYLYRYTRDGKSVGDTWHPSAAEAREQASFEFEITAWREVPTDVVNAVSFILSDPR